MSGRSMGVALILVLGGASAGTGMTVDGETERGPETVVPIVQEASDLDPGYGCLICHSDKRRAFILGVHSDRGVRCHDCHGGDPGALEIADAHTGDFRGPLGKLAIVEVCSECHGDPNQMRQFGLPADQVAELRTSRHGMLLFEEGSEAAPTCSDCHDPHTTLRADDARSSAYPTNIPDLCAVCHEDEDLMAPYGIPTGQVVEHRRSAHGKAVFEELNFAAPSCIGCHGSHAALPPDVGEIANVCGKCHAGTRKAFESGPHGADGRLGCTACHSNHDTERIAADRVAETCMSCHASDSAPALLGQEIEKVLVRGEHGIEAAHEAIEELVRAGHAVTDTRFRYRTALTQNRRLGSMQHSLDLEQLVDLERQLGSISRDIVGEAEVSAEEKWEHKLFLIPVWFFALGTVVLAGSRLRRLSGPGGAGTGRPGGD